MPTTTFAGPVKAGGISTSTGNILGENVANQGFAKMVQVAQVIELGHVGTGNSVWTDIVIPANSQIIRMALLTTTAFDSTYGYIYVDDDRPSDPQIGAVPGLTIGLSESTGSLVGDLGKWKEVGTSDIHLSYHLGSTSTGSAGVGTLIVEYVQNNNLTA